jgi:hypothetical protein
MLRNGRRAVAALNKILPEQKIAQGRKTPSALQLRTRAAGAIVPALLAVSNLHSVAASSSRIFRGRAPVIHPFMGHNVLADH